ncbi:unnamed protein product [Phytophthora fragariaefolia]|uniref:Unnamed protein product n=1 Tax=Phytophthora fragariaefolia TaxID=1490495 RepID=A0A9W6U438_9STRA|nr:unnamed protein product [Phytophthora fragariaefolia]
MARQQVTTEMDEKLYDDADVPCWSCKAAKMTRMSYKKITTRQVKKPFQKLMSDMCYMGMETFDGYKHFQLRRRRDGDASSTHTEVESFPACAGAPAVLPLSDIEVPPSTAVEDRSLQRGVNTPHVTWTEADVREEERELRPSNSGSTVESFPTESRGTSPSVGEGRMDGEDKAPIAFGDPARSMDEVADAISDSGSEDDIEMNATAESFRRSTRTRWPNARYQGFEVELPMSLVIDTVNALMDHETLVERPMDKKVLTGKWVLVQKRNAHGNVVRHRARITIKGCQQRYGVDYWETYAPVVSQESLKLILLLALHYGLSCRHVDFVTAFLNGPIDDDVEIYMEMPEYFDDGSDRVCKLRRSLYGLKQAPLIWYQTLDKHLRSCDFHRLKMDGGLYARTVGGSPIFVSVYVDDLVIAGTDDNIELVMQGLRAKFEIKDLGPVTDLLHMEISYVPDRVLWISQRGYIDKLLKRFGMESCRPVTTPQAVGHPPDPVDDDQPGVNDPNIPYRELVGGLQYLMQGTHPDIANAVRTLGEYLSKYTKEHFVIAKRVLRYLKATRDYGLVWNKPATTDLHFTAYADADLRSEKDDRRSITGYVLLMNGCTYAYKSHKQSIAQDDTCSAEFIAAAECSG